MSQASYLARVLFFVIIPFSFAVFSILYMLHILADATLYKFLQYLVPSYEYILKKIGDSLEPYMSEVVEFFAKKFSIDLELRPYWKAIFVPVWFYLSYLAWYARDRGRWWYVGALFIVAFVFASAISIFLASHGSRLALEPALATLILAMPLFELLAYAFLISLVRPQHRTSAPPIEIYLIEKPLLSVAMGFLTLVIGWSAFSDDEASAAFSLLIFILLLGARDITLALYHARRNRAGWPGEFSERLPRSKSWKLGIRICAVILLAFVLAI